MRPALQSFVGCFQLFAVVLGVAAAPFGIPVAAFWIYVCASLLLIIGLLKILPELPQEHGIAAELNWFLPAAMIPTLAITATVAETLFGLFLVFGWKARITALLSGALLIAFALTKTMALGVKAPLTGSVFSAAGVAASGAM